MKSIPPGTWTNLLSSSSIAERVIRDFDVPDSKFSSVLKKLLVADFKRRVNMEGKNGTTGQPIPERKTNRVDDL